MRRIKTEDHELSNLESIARRERGGGEREGVCMCEGVCKGVCVLLFSNCGEVCSPKLVGIRQSKDHGSWFCAASLMTNETYA